MSPLTPKMANKTDHWDTHERYTGFAATTPYVWPTGCPPLGSIQNYTVRREPGDNSEKVIFEDLRIVWAMGDGPDWVRCLPKEPYEDPDPLPSGAPNNAYWTYSRSAIYSPGVCPTGWDAMNVGVTSQTDKYHDQFHGNSGDVKSTAVCCMRGDSIDTKLVSWLPHCVGKEAADGHHETVFITKTSTRRVGVSTSVSSATWTYQYYSNDKDYTTTRSGLQSDISFEYPEETHTYTWTTGQFWYPAWSIVWDNNDTSTMSPKPPALTNDMLIPTWTEGMVLENGKYDNGGRGQASRSVTMTSASESSTTTNRNAVTTPFVFSSGCLPPGFVTTITQQIDLWETITERIRFLFHLDREWRNCLPDVEGETTYSYPSTTVTEHGLKTASYSAAVCPSGWWALNMGLSTHTGWNALESWDGITTVLTTAQCCSSWDFIATPKYENGIVVGGFDDHCVESRIQPYNTRTPITIPFTDRYTSWIKSQRVITSTIIDTSHGVTTTSTSSYFWESPSYSESTGIHTWTEGQFFYPRWSIVWKDSDTSTMSPKPPALSNDMLIRTWYPGMQIVSGLWDWRGSGTKSWTQTVTATEMTTTTETISASTVVRIHYVQVAGPGGVDEEEKIRSGLLPPKIVDKPVKNSVETGGKVASATEVDGTVLAVRLLVTFLWLSFMAGGAWMFWLKRRRRRSKGEIESEERLAGPPHYMKVLKQEKRRVPRRNGGLRNANDNTTDHPFHHLNDDIALRVEVRKS